MKYGFPILCIALAACSAFAQSSPATPKDEVIQMANAGNEFAVDLYHKLAEPKGNLFFSPNSIQAALAMTYAGSAGDTAAQMAKTLHFGLPQDKAIAAEGDLLKQLSPRARTREGGPSFELVVANALWPQKGFAIKKDFIQLIQGTFGAQLQELDYAQADAASKTINDWVAGKTNDKIKDLVPASALSPATRLVLTNAIYFKSNWAEQFKKANTADKPFFLPDGKTTNVPTMTQQRHFGYMENDELQVLELPYLYNELSMFVVLPKAKDGLAAVEGKLDQLPKWLQVVQSAEAQVFLPKWKFSSSMGLAETLAKLGMVDAFDAGKADFSGMTAEQKLFISAVLHKAFVAVDEDGTEAAAATAVMMVGSAMMQPQEPKVFNADHPFLFVIRHNATGAILFMGRVEDPTAK